MKGFQSTNKYEGVCCSLVVLSFNPAEIDLRLTDARSVTVPNFPTLSLSITHSTVYSALSVLTFLSTSLLQSRQLHDNFTAINPDSNFLHFSPSCIIAFPDTPCLMWPFPCIAVALPCVGHVALLNPLKRRSLFNNCQLEVFCLITVFTEVCGECVGSDHAIVARTNECKKTRSSTRRALTAGPEAEGPLLWTGPVCCSMTLIV